MKFIKYFIAGLSLGFVVLSIAFWLHFTSQTFIVFNNANETIDVTAYWRDTQKQLDKIKPNQIIRFNVDDEASMKFKVMLSNGKQLESEEIYFTQGMDDIEVTVTNDDIRLKYAFENERQ
ncbi:hypothetical protein [Thalassotalea mangrovi]|uniref:Uncharacterized protein n=1 Tax=Thalassotalea mangrovi TaxID=2572245 RepID=A0A4U1B6J8_9GAMM|nr:hypothetical protein [Thalassotalea mangrovi]TKB45785.1 hypothetical protein E8M12_06970 [Thalassotalea mangrovi]